MANPGKASKHLKRKTSCAAVPMLCPMVMLLTAAGPGKAQGWISGVLPAKSQPAQQGCPAGLTEASCKACQATQSPSQCYQCALKVTDGCDRGTIWICMLASEGIGCG